MTRGHLVKLLEIDLSITVHVKHSDHLIDFFISDIFTKSIQHESNFSDSNVSIAIHIKSEEGLFDLVIREGLIIEHTLYHTLSLLSIESHACTINYSHIAAASTAAASFALATLFFIFILNKLLVKGLVYLGELS